MSLTPEYLGVSFSSTGEGSPMTTTTFKSSAAYRAADEMTDGVAFFLIGFARLAWFLTTLSWSMLKFFGRVGRLICRAIAVPIGVADGWLSRRDQGFNKAVAWGSFSMNLSAAGLGAFLVFAPPVLDGVDKIHAASGLSLGIAAEVAMSAVIAPDGNQPINESQLRLAADWAGLTEEEISFFSVIAGCESAMKPWAINLNKDGSRDLGFAQINTGWHGVRFENPDSPDREALALIPNLRIAADIYRQEGPKVWECYKKLVKNKDPDILAFIEGLTS